MQSLQRHMEHSQAAPVASLSFVDYLSEVNRLGTGTLAIQQAINRIVGRYQHVLRAGRPAITHRPDPAKISAQLRTTQPALVMSLHLRCRCNFFANTTLAHHDPGKNLHLTVDKFCTIPQGWPQLLRQAVFKLGPPARLRRRLVPPQSFLGCMLPITGGTPRV